MTEDRTASLLRLPGWLIFAAIFVLLLTSRFGNLSTTATSRLPPHEIDERVEIK